MIRAVTLDLDDTLWAIAPAIVRAEQRMDDWLRRHFPAVATRWSIPRLRELRDRVAAEHPELAHDFSAQRRLSLRHAFGDSLGADHHAIGCRLRVDAGGFEQRLITPISVGIGEEVDGGGLGGQTVMTNAHSYLDVRCSAPRRCGPDGGKKTDPEVAAATFSRAVFMAAEASS